MVASKLYLATLATLTRSIQVQGAGASGPAVDLGYGIYTGVSNASTKLNVWKGIRYAAPPVGALRWQAPQPPVSDRTPVLAASFGPACPQSYARYLGVAFTPGNEDCLYLNVYSPAGNSAVGNATGGLPVVVWIHGGGYGQGDASQQDPSALINANDNGLVAVTIQYRVSPGPHPSWKRSVYSPLSRALAWCLWLRLFSRDQISRGSQFRPSRPAVLPGVGADAHL